MFGWVALTLLIGGSVLALAPLARLTENNAGHPALAWPVGAAVLAGLLTAFTLMVGAFNPDARPEERPDRGQLLFRTVVAAAGMVPVGVVFPARHLDTGFWQSATQVPPGVVVELWAAVCLIALGLLLMLGASSTLQIRHGRRALLGVAVGALAVVLMVTLASALPRLMLVEHTTAEALAFPAP